MLPNTDPAVLAMESTPNKTGLEQGELTRANNKPMTKGGTFGIWVTICGRGILIKPRINRAMSKIKLPMTIYKVVLYSEKTAKAKLLKAPKRPITNEVPRTKDDALRNAAALSSILRVPI